MDPHLSRCISSLKKWGNFPASYVSLPEGIHVFFFRWELSKPSPLTPFLLTQQIIRHVSIHQSLLETIGFSIGSIVWFGVL